jgi:hypothetical protein
MAKPIQLVQGDTKPALVCTLKDKDTNAALVVTGATPRLYFRAEGGTTVLDTLVGIVVDGTNGVVKFDWGATTLAQSAGYYEGEIEVTFLDGTKQTVYDVLRFDLREDFA